MEKEKNNLLIPTENNTEVDGNSLSDDKRERSLEINSLIMEKKLNKWDLKRLLGSENGVDDSDGLFNAAFEKTIHDVNPTVVDEKFGVDLFDVESVRAVFYSNLASICAKDSSEYK